MGSSSRGECAVASNINVPLLLTSIQDQALPSGEGVRGEGGGGVIGEEGGGVRGVDRGGGV